MKFNKSAILVLLLITLSFISLSCTNKIATEIKSLKITDTNKIIKSNIILALKGNAGKSPIIFDSLDEEIMYYMLDSRNQIIKDKSIDIKSFNLKTKENKIIYKVDNTQNKNLLTISDYIPLYIYDEKRNKITLESENVSEKVFDLYRIGNYEKKYISEVFRNNNLPFLGSIYFSIRVNSFLKGNYVYYLYSKDNNFIKVGIFDINTNLFSILDLEIIESSLSDYPPFSIYETKNYFIIQYKDLKGDNIKIKPKTGTSKFEKNLTNSSIIGGDFQNDIVIVKDTSNENIKIIKIRESAIVKEVNLKDFLFKNAYCKSSGNILDIVVLPFNFIDGLDSKFIKIKFDIRKNRIIQQKIVNMDIKFTIKNIRFKPESDKITALVKESGKSELGTLDFAFDKDEAYYSLINGNLHANTFIDKPFKAYTNYLIWFESYTDPLTKTTNGNWNYIN